MPIINDLLDHFQGFRRQLHDLAAPIAVRFAPDDPTVVGHAVEQVRKRRRLDTDAPRQLLLHRSILTRQVQQHQPLRLAQPERLQALIQRIAPQARGFANQYAEILLRFGHDPWCQIS
jgi:hypothetical protein